jgi:hypothetical protein
MKVLFDVNEKIGIEAFKKYKNYKLNWVQIIDGEVYASSVYELPKDFDEFALSKS